MLLELNSESLDVLNISGPGREKLLEELDLLRQKISQSQETGLILFLFFLLIFVKNFNQIIYYTQI